MIKNPDTGKRVSRPNPEDQWHRAPAPQLQIVTREIFEHASKIRRERRRLVPVLRRNPKRLLSGLLRCATCGGGISIKGKDRGGTRVICTAFHNTGRCENNRSYYLHHIEELVLSGIRKHLVDPRAIRSFLQAYQVERKRLADTANSVRPQIERRLGELNRQIGRLVDAMAASESPVSDYTVKISALESERREFEAKLQLSKPNKQIRHSPGSPRTLSGPCQRSC
jgi:hypothetical protein